ncbi:MAG: GDSL-type esterase/lipase family protein, partial [Actinomycetota bacterium]|nr:GDSL-type esterase/lipase family protein [Actinomycetota bacterium]
AATGRRVRVVGYAVSGARTDTVRRRQVPRLTGRRLDAILVVAGANDVTHATPPWALRHRTAALLDALAATHPEAGVVLAGIPEFGTVPAFAQPLRAVLGAYADVLRGLQRDVAAARRGVGFVDLARRASPRFIGRPASMSPDGFHPAALGYGFWADALAPAVVDALGATAAGGGGPASFVY